MNKSNQINFLVIIKILLIIVLITILLFYLLVVLPEYLACVELNSEGAMGKDIWGNDVQCFGESKDISESFFQFFSIIIGCISVVLIFVYYFIFHLKNSLKKNEI